MKVLFVSIALAAISMFACAQGSDARVYQSISITIADHMDVKIDKMKSEEKNEGEVERENGSTHKAQSSRTNISSSKSKSVIYSNYILSYRTYTKESLAIKGRTKERSLSATEPTALMHTISAY